MKKTLFYKELRYLYRSLFLYKRPFSYLYYRFIIGPKIKKVKNPLDNPVGTNEYSIHLLCSHNDLLMMFWSLASWHSVVRNSGQVYIHEDGSFTEGDKYLIAKLFPNAKNIDFEWASREAVNEWLTDYPKARKYREKAISDKNNIFAVKLIDPRFVGKAKTKLIIDTDLGWLKKPEEILNFIEKGYTPFATQGTEPMNFSFFDDSKLSISVSDLNSGIVGYSCDDYQKIHLEEFSNRIGDNTDPHFIEQAGYAWILSRINKIKYLPIEKYHIKGSVTDSTVVKHYTGPRREQFWIEGVKNLILN